MKEYPSSLKNRESSLWAGADSSGMLLAPALWKRPAQQEASLQHHVIEQSIDVWTKEPEKARVSPLVKARSEGAQAVLEAGPFSWRLDLPPTLGGGNTAAGPTALLLGALSGCAVLFIRDTLAPQLGVSVDSVQAEARCRADYRGLLGMPGALPDLTDIEITIHIQSPDSADKVQGLYQAWLERCPVYLALTKPLLVGTALLND